ncbi:MAG: DUF47 family protein [Candidatus Bathyarchaeia archaeon]
MGEKSYTWFERRRRNKALELAQEQIEKALGTVRHLDKAMQSLQRGEINEMQKHIETLFETEEEVDKLRREVFTEMSKGVALVAEYREDILHLVKRLDTLADHVKDAARCLKILRESKIPKEIIEKVAKMTEKLVECASTLKQSIERIAAEPEEAIKYSLKVAEIEQTLDGEYLETKKLLITYSDEINMGAMVIIDDLIEFIEHAADICADTADYILTLSNSKQ